MNHTTIDHRTLVQALVEQAANLKAETLLAHVIAGGFPREEFTIGTGLFFERPYGNDLTDARTPDDRWMHGMVQVQLSRPGFYDMLPEGLFFQPAGMEYNSAMGVAEMAALHRWNRTKEKGIRSFFQPFEHAGFYQLLQLEEEERNLLRGSEQGMLYRYFREFWELPAVIPDQAAGILIRLIPHASRIAGDLPLMQECLSLLLGDPVTILPVPAEPTEIGEELATGLGGQSLGNDMVCGDSFPEDYPCWEYRIGPLDGEKVLAYVPGAAQQMVIETFNRFFLPAEAKAETKIEVDAGTVRMELEPGREPVLGYSSLLVA